MMGFDALGIQALGSFSSPSGIGGTERLAHYIVQIISIGRGMLRG